MTGGLFLRQANPDLGAEVEDVPMLSTQAPPLAPDPVAIDGTTDDDVYAALDESPDLYVWLESGDTENLVTE